MPSSSSELLTLAFRLAFFVHCDRTTALRVATEAYAKLEVAAAAQDKRLYYTPVGRSASEVVQHGQRTKVAMSEVHLLQRLVYIESDSFERDQERPPHLATLDEEDMVVRFVKHLIRITTRRNSFYVTLGLSRLLFNYSTAETSSMYNSVIQDSERIKDDYYYRSRKRKLIQELQERFGDLIHLQRGRHGEERFEVSARGTLWGGLVQECLAHFTPWKTNCVIPEKWDPVLEELPELGFQGHDPDNEHPVEIRRMHSILHPDCYKRLCKALGYADPSEKLTVPRFFIPNSESGSPKDRGRGIALSEAELAVVQTEMAERASRRRSYSAGLLRIRVDGVERHWLDLNRERSIRFDIEEEAELVEVLGQHPSGEVLLATHVLSMEQDAAPRSTTATASVTLEGGQRVTFSLLPRTDPASGAGASLQVAYAETRVLRATLLSGRQALSRLFGTGQRSGAKSPRLLAPVMALSLTLLITAALVVTVVMVRRQATQSPEDRLASVTEPPTGVFSPSPTASPFKAPADSNNLNENKSPIRPKSTTGLTPGVGPRIPNHSHNNNTRSIRQPAYAAVSLRQVRLVYVDPLGEGAFADSVRTMLGSTLSQTGRFTLETVRENAQAVFKGEAKEGAVPGRGHVSLRLIGPDGSSLWSFETTGTSAEVADAANHALARKVQNLQQK
ncbi:MAG: hypothetical protein ACREDR_11130 [Blastocatellia bacterium]